MQYCGRITKEGLHTHTHTHTHTQNNIIAFPRQQWLCEAPHHCIINTPHVCLTNTDKMYFSLLIYSNKLSSRFRIDWLLFIIRRQLLYMQHMVFTMLKILKLCKITYIYIVIKSTKYCFVCKISDYIKSFFDNIIIAENAMGSYATGKCCTYSLRRLTASS
jgi:hypothetical protein